jgi:menaquinone-specific isochorismate synthase
VPQWYFPDFFLTMPTPWATHENWELLTSEELIKRLGNERLGNEEEPIKIAWESPFEDAFDRGFEQLKNLFLEKKLAKAVPYMSHTGSGPVSLKQMLLAGLKNASALALYGCWDEHEGILGATPELLFELENEQQLNTMACAATLSFDEEPTAALASKLQKEHGVVISCIEEALKPLGSVNIGQTHWQRFQALKHLITPIECALKQPISFQQIVERLHPTSALGAYPKEEGMKWLASYDKQVPRKRFGAPVGCVFQERAICRVGIRNVQWEAHTAMIGAGVGVIAESTIHEEKKELLAKIATVKGNFNL